MALQYQAQYIDDIDGTDLGDSAETITFSFNGKDYTIDLGEANAEAFHEAITPYVEAAQKVSGAKRRSTRKSGGKNSAGDTKAIRAWARENGYNVSERGRIPADVMAAYTDAH